MVKGIADPDIAQSVWSQALVVLRPDLLILEGIGLLQASRQIPCQGV